MALVNPNLTFVELSASGKEITLKDATPSYAAGTTPVGANLILTNPFTGTVKESTITYDSTSTPTISQVTNGMAFKVNSVTLGDSTILQGLRTFKDGVLTFNYFPYTAAVAGVGTKGNHYIIGTGFIDILSNYEAIVVGKNVYNLDKSKPTNGGTVLYTVEEIQEDFTAFNPAYRSPLSVLIDSSVKSAIAEGASALAYPHNRTSGLKEGIRKLIHNFTASRIWFENSQYDMCNKAARESAAIISLYKLNGSCQ